MSRTWHALLFFVPTAVNGLLSVGAIPVLISAAGSGAWTRIAIGQSVGSVAMTLISFGWAISGPAAIGAMARANRPAAYAVSVTTRIVIALPAVAGAILVTWAVTEQVDPISTMSAIGTALLGLSSAWFFVGTDRPLALLLLDTMPKILAMLVGLGLAAATGNALLFPLSQIIGVIIATAVSWFAVVGVSASAVRQAAAPRSMARAVREQSSGVLASLGYSAFTYAPLPLITVVLPDATTAFAIVDKVQKLLTTAASPVGNLLVARMAGELREGRADRHDVVRTALRAAFIVAAATAVVAAVAAAVLIPIASAGSFRAQWWVLALLAVTVAAGFLGSTIPAVCLAPLGRVRSAVHATLLGLITVIVLLLAATQLGAPLLGALLAVSIASLLIVGIEIAAVRRARSRASDPIEAADIVAAADPAQVPHPAAEG